MPFHSYYWVTHRITLITSQFDPDPTRHQSQQRLFQLSPNVSGLSSVGPFPDRSLPIRGAYPILRLCSDCFREPLRLVKDEKPLSFIVEEREDGP